MAQSYSNSGITESKDDIGPPTTITISKDDEEHPHESNVEKKGKKSLKLNSTCVLIVVLIGMICCVCIGLIALFSWLDSKRGDNQEKLSEAFSFGIASIVIGVVMWASVIFAILQFTTLSHKIFHFP